MPKEVRIMGLAKAFQSGVNIAGHIASSVKKAVESTALSYTTLTAVGSFAAAAALSVPATAMAAAAVPASLGVGVIVGACSLMKPDMAKTVQSEPQKIVLCITDPVEAEKMIKQVQASTPNLLSPTVV